MKRGCEKREYYDKRIVRQVDSAEYNQETDTLIQQFEQGLISQGALMQARPELFLFDSGSGYIIVRQQLPFDPND